MLFSEIKKVIDYGEYRVSIKDDGMNYMLDIADDNTEFDNYKVYKIEGALDQDNDLIVHVILENYIDEPRENEKTKELVSENRKSVMDLNDIKSVSELKESIERKEIKEKKKKRNEKTLIM